MNDQERRFREYEYKRNLYQKRKPSRVAKIDWIVSVGIVIFLTFAIAIVSII